MVAFSFGQATIEPPDYDGGDDAEVDENGRLLGVDDGEDDDEPDDTTELVDHPFKTLADWWHGYNRQIEEIYCVEVGERGSAYWIYYEIRCRTGPSREGRHEDKWVLFREVGGQYSLEGGWAGPSGPFFAEDWWKSPQEAFKALCDHFAEHGDDHPDRVEP